MIVVKVILVSGIDGEITELGSMTICNDGSGSDDTGNYFGAMKAEYGQRKFIRRNFHRKTQSVWTLIGSILSKLGHVKGVKDVREITAHQQQLFNLDDNAERKTNEAQ